MGWAVLAVVAPVMLAPRQSDRVCGTHFLRLIVLSDWHLGSLDPIDILQRCFHALVYHQAYQNDVTKDFEPRALALRPNVSMCDKV